VDTICNIITKLELGGAQEVALYAVSHLDRTRFRRVLMAGPGGLLTEEARRLPGVDLIIVPTLGRRIHAISDLVAFLHLVRLLHRVKPAIVHTHSSKAGILGRWAAWCAGVPLIFHTVHGFGITPAQPRWLQHLLIVVERITGWITTHWVVVAAIDEERGRRWGLFNANVSVIRPGIDPRPFQQPPDSAARRRLREELGAGPDDLLVGTVACLKPQKAPEDLVAVAELVCSRMPKVKFVLIGDGALRPRIQALIDQRGLHERVRLAGWRRATKVGGVEEAVVHRDRTRLYEPRDIAGLAEGVAIVLQQRRTEGTSPVTGRLQQLPKEFHIEEMVKQYQSLYDRLLSQRRKLASRSLSPASS
jgi:glycosyltransferase involved in cell wall biosynthesis